MEPKPVGLARGTRDFGPSQMRRRKHVFQVLESLFRKYGFGPLETPAMEQTATLTGKYGEEGDRLIFHVLNSGNFAEGIDADTWAGSRQDPRKLLHGISEKALRYDLTVPLARYVSMNHGHLHFPFKRYQIQPVWRADRPQKGRFREFVQCDADLVGYEVSLFHRAEFLQLYAEAFEALGFTDFAVKVNDRRLLALLAEWGGIPQSWARLGLLLDKLDKQSWGSLEPELRGLGLGQEALSVLGGLYAEMNRQEGGRALDWATFRAFWEARLQEAAGSGSAALVLEGGRTALEELDRMWPMLLHAGKATDRLTFDPFLARGIDYYTGLVVEVVSPGLGLGSLGGGGYYQGLTAMFGYPDIVGMGISFGAERIVEGMEQLGLFQPFQGQEDFLLAYSFDDSMEANAQTWTSRWRSAGFDADWYQGTGKFKKALEYARQNSMRWMVLFAPREWEQGEVTVLDVREDRKTRMPPEGVADFLTSKRP